LSDITAEQRVSIALVGYFGQFNKLLGFSWHIFMIVFLALMCISLCWNAAQQVRPL